MTDPVAVEVLRGGRVESVHRVAACLVDVRGRVLLTVGDVERPIFPRSAIKPIQAVPLVESGAAEAFAVTPAELALACSSHNGETAQTATVRAWLERIGLAPADLACGGHWPTDPETAHALSRAGETPDRACDNCSGKHTGMLATARHLGEPSKGYEQPDHPVQRRIAAALAEMAERDALTNPAIDGCSAPNWALPLAALALAFARFGAPDTLAPERAAACRRVAAAMIAHPENVAGRGRLCTALMRAAPHLLVKTGAEGVFAGAWPERRLGFALKVEDGAGRAAEVALLALLRHLGALDEPTQATLAAFGEPETRSRAGAHVGLIRARAADWLGDARL
jgi:L-asparaginase II